ncbi:MAG TPA: hypothetical protein VLZ81_09870 [Blastocatellia bacterium]|nr:hypothetical protein [Blastocatellia bacterium]
MLTLWIVWAVLTLAVITLAVYRKMATRHEDDYVHLADAETQVISQQVTVAQRLEKIDSWGKTLTIVDVAFLAVILAVMCYNAWQSSLESMK